MKIVIDVPEDKYRALQVGMKCGVGIGMLEKAVLNGMILPKVHGRLKDIDALNFDDIDFYDPDCFYEALDVIREAPTIIEADTESEGKE